jgi:hypothetical protein
MALGELSDDGVTRLVAYCEMGQRERREFVPAMLPRGPGRVAMTNRWMRELLWSDVEVRAALLRMDFDRLREIVETAYGGPGPAFVLLDFASAMTYEAEQRAVAS